jgi:hypothetical protein
MNIGPTIVLPFVVKLMFPLPAREGTATDNLEELASIIVALLPLKNTLFPAGDALNPVPFIVTIIPTPP